MCVFIRVLPPFHLCCSYVCAGKVHIPPLSCEHYHKGCQTDPWPTIPDNAEGTGPEPTSPASPRSLASR
jgi:hypothetical protein